MDMRVRTNPDPRYSGDIPIDGDDDIDDSGGSLAFELNDTTTFSIVFSKTGKLVIHDVRVRNRDGYMKSDETDYDNFSYDDVFNITGRIRNRMAPDLSGMFHQDDYYEDPPGTYLNIGYGQEESRNNFVIYDRNVFDGLPDEERFSQYLKYLNPFYINAYTGELVK